MRPMLLFFVPQHSAGAPCRGLRCTLWLQWTTSLSPARSNLPPNAIRRLLASTTAAIQISRTRAAAGTAPPISPCFPSGLPAPSRRARNAAMRTCIPMMKRLYGQMQRQPPSSMPALHRHPLLRLRLALGAVPAAFLAWRRPPFPQPSTTPHPPLAVTLMQLEALVMLVVVLGMMVRSRVLVLTAATKATQSAERGLPKKPLIGATSCCSRTGSNATATAA